MKKINLNKKSLLKGIAAGIASVLFSTGAFAQTTITVNSALSEIAGSRYQSIANAVTYINGATVPAGGFIVDVPAGHSENTTTGISITKSTTAANPIIIQKSGVGNNPIINTSKSTAPGYGINIQEGDYITFNGIDISGTSVVEYGYYITENNGTGSSNNTIKNAKITLDRTNTSSIGIYQVNTRNGISNSNNVFENITIENAYAGIYLFGRSATVTDAACIITNCTIGAGATSNDIGNGTVATYGIKASFQSGITISSNTVRNVTGTGATAVDGIVFVSTAGTNNVYNNKIETIASTSTGGTVKGINITNTNATSTVNIYNNTITGLNSANTTAATRGVVGIYLTGAVAGAHNVDFNSVRIAPTTVSSSNACIEIANVTPINKLRNNIFSNFTAAQTGSAKHYAIVTVNATSIGGTNSVSNNNDLFINNTTNGFVGLTNATDRAALTGAGSWNTITSQDANSVSVDPFFTSATDLQTANCVLKEKGTTLSITTDAYSNTRTSTPSIGAYDMPSMVRSGTWIGVTSNAWAITSNWCDGALPTSGVNVTIDSRYPNQPTVATGTATANNITIGTSASLTVSGGTLNYAGTVTNNGTFNFTSGSLTLSGSNQVVPVSTVTDLTITSPTVSITSDLTVNGTLTLSSGGILTTGSNKVILGSSGSISENATSYVLGIVETQRTVTNSTENFGGLGLSVTAGGSQPGVTTVTRTNGDAGIGTYGSNSGIKRKYNISAANNTGLDATVVFSYLDAELNGLTESTLLLYRSTNGGVNWVEVSSNLNTTANTLTATGVNGFSVWTMGSSVTPLPVNLVSFNAVRKNASTVSLSWKTSSELNNDRFEVERSQDGINFMNVGEVKGNGTANHIISYGFEDNAMSVNAPVLYYRLKQVDYNGAFEYSPIVRLANTTAVADIKAWYNQSEGKINLSTINTVSEIVNIKVINIQGRVVAERSAQLTKGSNNIQLDVQNLPNGIYTSIISSENGTYTSKILKN